MCGSVLASNMPCAGKVPEEFLREEQVYSAYQNYKDSDAQEPHASSRVNA